MIDNNGIIEHDGLSSPFPTVSESMTNELSSYKQFKCPLKETCDGNCSNCLIIQWCQTKNT